MQVLRRKKLGNSRHKLINSSTKNGVVMYGMSSNFNGMLVRWINGKKTFV